MTGQNLDISKMSPSALLELRAELKARADEIKAETTAINTELAMRFAEDARSRMDATGKMDGGSLSYTTPDGLKVKAKVDKKVTWDQAQLRAVAANMTFDEVFHYFKIDFSVSESIFKALPPGDLRARIEKARTVKPSDLKIEVEAADS